MSHLANRLARGDSAAFAELYDLCGDRPRGRKRCPPRSVSSPCSKKRGVSIRENPIAYTFQVARNEANRWISKSIRMREQYQLLAADLFAESASNHSRSDEWSETLTKALVSLPDEQREVVVLRIHSGFAFREIAAITETPQGTVATRYRRGIEKLRELVGDWE